MEKLIDTARASVPADLLLINARVVNVFSGEIIPANVAVAGGTIAGVGNYTEGKEVVDLQGSFLLPGLIDAHIHIESSLLTPGNFAAAVLPHGTTSVIADPHEIVNVLGGKGLDYMINACRDLPLKIFFMIPSCVPATHLETSGAEISSAEIGRYFQDNSQVLGLAEMMNFPGVYLKDPETLEKIKAARKNHRIIDGHAPALEGSNLNAYIGAGISSDHECISTAEAMEKLRLGMHILVREGSAAKNLAALMPMINEKNWPYFSFCSDDRHSEDLIMEGEIDHILRKAVDAGLDPIQAVRMATINTARHYQLPGLGAVAPGYQADLAVVNNLKEFKVELVFQAGKPVAKDGKMIEDIVDYRDLDVMDSVHLPDLKGKLQIKRPQNPASARVIQVLPDQIISRQKIIPVEEIGPDRDIITVSVVERHNKNGNVALGLVQGFGIKNGALASTVAHDSHNLILVGDNEDDMILAAHTVEDFHGGLAVVAKGKVLAFLELPVAGLMSMESASFVAERYSKLLRAAGRIGCTLLSPFMTMSFLALPVIPELKITDKGLIDVQQFAPVSLFV